jgi:hypothetical protein
MSPPALFVVRIINLVAQDNDRNFFRIHAFLDEIQKIDLFFRVDSLLSIHHDDDAINVAFSFTCFMYLSHEPASLTQGCQRPRVSYPCASSRARRKLNVEPFLLHLTAFAKLDIVLGDLLEVDVAERGSSASEDHSQRRGRILLGESTTGVLVATPQAQLWRCEIVDPTVVRWRLLRTCRETRRWDRGLPADTLPSKAILISNE